MNRTRIGTALAASALLVTALAGCGDDEKEPAAASSSASADGSSAPSATATPAAGTPVPVAAFVKDLSAAMKDQTSVHMSIRGSGDVLLDADVRYGRKPAIRLETTLGGPETSLLVVGGTLYLEQEDGRYLKVDEDDPTYGGLLDSFKDFGPRSSVKSLQSGIAEIVEVGPETVDGEELVRYDVTADTSKAAGAFSQLAGSGAGDRFVTLRFYLEPDGLVRQISVDVDGQVVSMTFSDWGKPVDIVAPTGAQLVTPTT